MTDPLPRLIETGTAAADIYAERMDAGDPEQMDALGEFSAALNDARAYVDAQKPDTGPFDELPYTARELTQMDIDSIGRDFSEATTCCDYCGGYPWRYIGKFEGAELIKVKKDYCGLWMCAECEAKENMENMPNETA